MGRVKGINMGHGTKMGRGLFLVSKNQYLPETIRNIQREQKKTYSGDSMTTLAPYWHLDTLPEAL